MLIQRTNKLIAQYTSYLLYKLEVLKNLHTFNTHNMSLTTSQIIWGWYDSFVRLCFLGVRRHSSRYVTVIRMYLLLCMNGIAWE